MDWSNKITYRGMERYAVDHPYGMTDIYIFCGLSFLIGLMIGFLAYLWASAKDRKGKDNG